MRITPFDMKSFLFISLSACVLLWNGMASLMAQEATGKEILVVPVQQEIDPRLNRQVKLGLEEAIKRKVALVVLEMNTYGGILNDADQIRQRVLEHPQPVYAFINKNAASGGALIAIACDKIYMTKGGSIGAATVVNSQDGSAAPDKYQSYMRSIMRSTAQANGRDPRIAEGMVDEEMEIDSLKPFGKVLTLTTSEALKYGYCDGEVESVEELLLRSGTKAFQISRYELPVSEKIIAFFLNPFISGILLLCILGGLYFELQSPGIGFPILVSLIALILYLVPYYLNGLAENWEILVFLAGLGLLGLEFFVIPGFGIAGITGIILLFTSLVLMMIGNNFFDFGGVDSNQVVQSLLTVVISFIAATVLVFFGGQKLLDNKRFKSLTLQKTLDREAGYTSTFLSPSLIGKTGVAYTVLRPSGKVMIEGEIYDATTRGDYIERDTPVVVLEQEVTSLRVKKT
jgi:membrane-bound serine protease (ClpP class)